MGVLKEKPSPREGINNDLKIKRLIIIHSKLRLSFK